MRNQRKNEKTILFLTFLSLIFPSCLQLERNNIYDSESNYYMLTEMGSIRQFTLSITANGRISRKGSETITQYGHVWGNSANPVLRGDNFTNLGNTDRVRSFSSSINITRLSPGQTYYMRTYSKNTQGTAYSSDEETFRFIINPITIQGTLNFGDVSVNTTVVRTITLRNPNNSSITISNISLPTGYSASWTSGTIAANSSRAVSISFRPTSAGSNYNGNLSVTQQGVTNAIRLSVNGSGEIGGSGQGQQQSPITIQGTLNFVDVPVDATVVRTIILRNPNNSSITISNISLPRGYSASWTSGTIAAYSFQFVSISFRPTSAGSNYNGSLSVTQQGITNAITFGITGQGIRTINLTSINGSPRGIWSDGTTIWVADWADDKLYAYTLSTGGRDTSKEFNLSSQNRFPTGICSDGTTIWVADSFYDKLYAYMLSTGDRNISKEFNLSSQNSSSVGIWSDGTTIWVADDLDDKLYAYTLSTGGRNTSVEFNLSSLNRDPEGIWSDGTTIWVADNSDAKLYAYTLSTGGRDTSKEFDLSSLNRHPESIWSDGMTIWVVDNFDDILYAYPLP